MWKRVRTVLAAGSLLGCILALGMWGRSVFVADVLWRDPPTGRDGFRETHTVYSRRGVIAFAHFRTQASAAFGPPERPVVWEYEARPVEGRTWLPGDLAGDRWRLGFGYQFLAAPRRDDRTKRPLFEGTTVAVPWWVIAAGLGVGPWRWVARRRRERWVAREGRCAGCGYDLRATPRRCPECGVGTVVVGEG